MGARSSGSGSKTGAVSDGLPKDIDLAVRRTLRSGRDAPCARRELVETRSIGNGTRDADCLTRVGQRGAEDFGSASRNEEDRSPAAAGRRG